MTEKKFFGLEFLVICKTNFDFERMSLQENNNVKSN